MKNVIKRIMGKNNNRRNVSQARPVRKNRLSRRPGVDCLEERQLMAVGGEFDPKSGLLSIYGTASSDVVTVDYATKLVDGKAVADSTKLAVSLATNDGYQVDQTFSTTGVKNIVFYGKAGNDLFSNSSSLPASIAATTGTVSSNLYNGSPNNNTPDQAPVGVFTVGSTGKVTIDYIFDGAGYKGQLAFYSLSGMSSFTPGTAAYNKEAARRAISDSTLGHITITVSAEAAKFSASLPWEGDMNTGHGKYQGPKSFPMKAGDTFGLMLIPNGTVKDVFNSPSAGGSLTPLYSIPAANPYPITSQLMGAQAADLDGHGSLFAFEDIRLDGGSDRDYNDMVFQVTGARGNEPYVGTVNNTGKDLTKQPIFTKDITTYTAGKESEDNEENSTTGKFAAGAAKVSSDGKVGVDFLYDGGGYVSEVAMFSLQGMGSLTPGSTAFIKEAARRALSNSVLGHVVISDGTEAAKYSTPVTWEPNFNAGTYKGVKTFAMTPGDKLGFMIVPAGTVWEVYNKPDNADPKKRPLFSMSEANPKSATLGADQFAQLDKDGHVFGFEDLGLTTNTSDRDYNDIVFRLINASDSAPAMAKVVNPGKNTLTTPAGAKILS